MKHKIYSKGDRNTYANGGMTFSKWLNDDSFQKEFNDWKEDGNVSKNADGSYSTQDAQYTNSLKTMSALKRYFYNEFIKGQYDSYAGGGEINKSIGIYDLGMNLQNKYRYDDYLVDGKYYQIGKIGYARKDVTPSYLPKIKKGTPYLVIGDGSVSKKEYDAVFTGKNRFLVKVDNVFYDDSNFSLVLLDEEYANGGLLDDINLVAKAIEYITGSAVEIDSIQFDGNSIAFRYKGQKRMTDISKKLIQDTISMHRKSLEMRGRYADGGEVKVNGLTQQDYIDAFDNRIEKLIQKLKEEGRYDENDFDYLHEIDKEGGFTDIEEVGFWLSTPSKTNYFVDYLVIIDYVNDWNDTLKVLSNFYFGKPIKIGFVLETGGDTDLGLEDELQKIKLLSNKIDFNKVLGFIDYDQSKDNTDLDFYKDIELVMTLKGDWNESTEELDATINVNGETAEFNYHPRDGFGNIDFKQLEKNINEAFIELNTYSAVVSIEGYEEYAEDVEGLENARNVIQNIKGNTRFQVLKGSSVGIGKRVDDSRVIEEFAKGGKAGKLKDYIIYAWKTKKDIINDDYEIYNEEEMNEKEVIELYQERMRRGYDFAVQIYEKGKNGKQIYSSKSYDDVIDSNYSDSEESVYDLKEQLLSKYGLHLEGNRVRTNFKSTANQIANEYDGYVEQDADYYIVSFRNTYKKGGEAGFDDAGTSMAMYHEKKGNWLSPKGQVYLWLYDVEDSGDKMQSGEFDYVFYPLTSMSMAWQSGYIPPLKRIWTKKFQKDHKGSEHLLGVIKAYLIEKEGKKELYIDMMSVNPKKKKKGIMSYMIKDLRDSFDLSQDQITFSKLTPEGEKFVAKKTYADGGEITIRHEIKNGKKNYFLYDIKTGKKSGSYKSQTEANDKLKNLLQMKYALKLSSRKYADGGETSGLITDEQVKDLSFKIKIKNLPRKKGVLLHEIITLEQFDLPDEEKINFYPFHLIYGDSSLAIFDAFGVDEVAGLKRADAEKKINELKAQGKTEKDGSFIAGLTNYVGDKLFMFFNVQRLSYEGFANRVLPHEALHLSRNLISLLKNDWVRENLNTPNWWEDKRAVFVSMDDSNEEFFAETLERTTAIAMDGWFRVTGQKCIVDKNKTFADGGEIKYDLDGNKYMIDNGNYEPFKDGDLAYNPFYDSVVSIYFDKNDENADDEDYVNNTYSRVKRIKSFDNGGNVDEIKSGDTISARWNEGMRWTNGTFIGETENGFEVYDFEIEKPNHIEYYAEISKDGYGGSKIYKSKKFKDRNYKNYHFSPYNDEYAKGGDVPHEDKMFQLPLEMVIYVPSTQDVDNVISVDEMTQRVGEVKEYLANKFGGYTSADKLGGFVDSKGNLVNEDVTQVTAFSTKEAFEENKEELIQQLAKWGKKWGQESIGFEFEGDLMYVPQEFQYADGGETQEVYIEYLNKEKGFKKDIKYFNSYDEAVKWARKNLENFNVDMINYK